MQNVEWQFFGHAASMDLGNCGEVAALVLLVLTFSLQPYEYSHQPLHVPEPDFEVAIAIARVASAINWRPALSLRNLTSIYSETEHFSYTRP